MTQLTLADGRPVTPYAFGCMQFGGTADKAASAALFEACCEAGLQHFDTAYVYTDGLSETWLGEFAQAKREDLFIATKVNFPGGGSRQTILSSFDESRRRLGMDHVDLLYMHRWTEDVPLEETFETLAQLQADGLTRFIGVSNYAAWQVMKAQSVAACFGTRIDVLQPMYNLVKRQVEVELLPMCASESITACTYSPLGGGLLTGKYASGGTGRLSVDDRYARRYGPEAMHTTARQLQDLAQDTGIDAATLAVAWVAAHPSVPHPILSARSVEQLRPSLAAMSLTLDDELYARISALSATPPPATDRLEEA